ncbi:glucose dehydrogenase [FAD, quinone]-like [Dermacentor andersoni]|uniref:glucose dehydrogenase [FAD, quinone]-like n=1 Tax=Dermacentor andersoni TaxID=34620 RepID=UPI003B3B32D9
MSGNIDTMACGLWGPGAPPQNLVGLVIAMVNLLVHLPFTDLPVLRDYELGELRQKYDYVIVGGGSAGCVIANRLSADPGITVLLLEAGGLEDASRQIPLTATYNLAGHDDWGYRTVPQRNACLSFHEQVSLLSAVLIEALIDLFSGSVVCVLLTPSVQLEERRRSSFFFFFLTPQVGCLSFRTFSLSQRCPMSRGKVLGGTSVLNFMMYVRGNRHDYDKWAGTYGAAGWSYEDVLPHFKDIEDFRAGPVDGEHCEPYCTAGFHGTDGEVPVAHPNGSTHLTKLFLDACKESGYSLVDYNGATQSGCSRLQVNMANGERFSSSKAFIQPVLRTRRNLDVALLSQVTKLPKPGTRNAYECAGKSRNKKGNSPVLRYNPESDEADTSPDPGRDHGAKVLPTIPRARSGATIIFLIIIFIPTIVTTIEQEAAATKATAAMSSVQKINFEGNHAVGATFTRYGKPQNVSARREVILSAGTIGSAQLLLLSGVGPREDLERLQIPVVADLPVGRSIQDHSFLYIAVPVITDWQAGISPFSLEDIAQFESNRSGIVTIPSAIEAVQFFGTQYAVGPDSTDIELGILSSQPASQLARAEVLKIGMLPEMQAYDSYLGPKDNVPGFRAAVIHNRPKSRGRITLHSSDPTDYPEIDLHMLEHPDDAKAAAEGTKNFIDRILTTKAMKSIGAKPWDVTFPPCADAGPRWSLEYIECLFHHLANPGMHICCSVPMGSHDSAVVDERLRVRGNVTGLRVADVSVMPEILTGNTNAAAMMIGSKAAAMIAEDNVNE